MLKSGDLVRCKFLDSPAAGGRSQDVAIVVGVYGATKSVYAVTSKMIVIHKNVVAFELLSPAQ